MKNYIIIPVGQATLSQSGADGMVRRQSYPSGVAFAFTSRFVALLTRVRNTVEFPICFVTKLPTTRRNHAVSNCSARTLELLEATGAAPYLWVLRFFHVIQNGPYLLGRLQTNF